MAPLTTLIVDDESSRAQLKTLLQEQSDFTIVGECGDAGSAVAAIRELAPSVVFLTAEGGGMQVIEQLNGDRLPAIVFVSSTDRYAAPAFDVGATDYLVKPFRHDRVTRALDRVRHTAVSRNGDSDITPATSRRVERIVLRTKDRVTWVAPAEVDWFEAAGNYARVHTGGRAHLIRASMSAIESRLDPDLFIRVNRSAIVNINRVRKAIPNAAGEYDLVLADEVTKIPLSRRYRAALEFLLGKL